MESPIFWVSAASVLTARGDRLGTASQAKSFFIGDQGGVFGPFRGKNHGSTVKSRHLKRGDCYVVSLQLYSSTPLFVYLQPKIGRICVKI
jgi:hypothetical protein